VLIAEAETRRVATQPNISLLDIVPPLVVTSSANYSPKGIGGFAGWGRLALTQ
jgi:hypothetical protein